jgi:hypothetical protein
MIGSGILSAKVLVAAAATAAVAGGAGAVLVTHPFSGGSGSSSGADTVNTSCPVPGSHPKFIAIMLQGINSEVDAKLWDTQPGQGASFNPAKVSYCANSASYPAFPFQPDDTRLTTPNNPNPVLQSMADGWLNYKMPPSIPGSTRRILGGPELNDPSTVYPGNGENLINDLAQAGGYVLPFSYFQLGPNGSPAFPSALMAGTAANPTFNFFSYDKVNVANSDPQLGNPPVLDMEIASVHHVFPGVPIVLIGHSNGGLIAEQWWLKYGTSTACGNFGEGIPNCGMNGVTHVFTLDSPVNGVAAGKECDNGFSPDPVDWALGQLVNALCGSAVGVGSTLGKDYSKLWDNLTFPSQANPKRGAEEGDQIITAMDSSISEGGYTFAVPGFKPQPGTFTASGTYGDPLYDFGDHPGLLSSWTGTSPHQGIFSQLIFSQKCLDPNNSLDYTDPQSGCSPLTNGSSSPPSAAHPPLDFVSPCGASYNALSVSSPQNPADKNYNLTTYGVPGSLYIHSEAKNCPGTVNMIVGYVRSLNRNSQPTTTRDVSACQVNMGLPSSAGPFQTALTTSALNKALGGNQKLTTQFRLNTTVPERTTAFDQTPSPSAVATCTWDGNGVHVVLSVTPYATLALAKSMFTGEPVAGASWRFMNGISDNARFFDSISGDSTGVSALTGNFFFHVEVGNVMTSADAVPVAQAIVQTLNTP